MLPLVAMQFTREMRWDTADFVILGAMLFAACGTYEFAVRMSASIAYRAATGLAVLGAFSLVWLNLAVGMIGTERDAANLIYGGVLVVGVAGAIVARGRPLGMARAMTAVAGMQGLVAIIALLSGSGAAVILDGFFVALWLASARLFRKAGASGRGVSSARIAPII
jgi:hypothetical protein